MENERQRPHGGDHPEVNSYGTDDPEAQAHIENARIDAARQRRHDRTRWARYVEAGANAEDASSLVEFEDILRAQTGHEPTEADRRGGHEQAPIEDTRADLTRMLELTQEPNGPAILADFARYLRQEAGDAAADMPTDSDAVERYRSAGLSVKDAATLAGFEYFLRAKLSRAGIETRHARSEGGKATTTYQPRIYVVDAANTQHGRWIDANQDPDELRAKIDSAVDRSPDTGGTTWEIRVSEAFAGLDLHGFTDFELISKLARGVAEHGAAFAIWVEIVGTANLEQLDRFEDFYVGSFASPVAWAREVGEDMEWDTHLDRVADPMLRPYLEINYARFARDQRQVWDVLQGVDGRTHVFMR